MLKRLYCNPASVICISLIVIIGGVIRFFGLPIALYPDTSRPVLYAIIKNKSMSPEDFKSRYGKDIESKLLSLDGVEDVSGTYRKGKVFWKVVFTWDTDTDLAQDDVKNSLNNFEAAFPDDWGAFRYYFKSNNNARIFLSVASEKHTDEELWNILQDRLKSKLERIDGIDTVYIVKPYDTYVRIDLNYDQILSYDITPGMIRMALLDKEYDRVLPTIKSSGGERFPLSIPLKDASISDLRQTIVYQKGDKILRLADVASVDLIPMPPDDLFTDNGKRALILGASIDSAGNIAQACDDFERGVRHDIASFDKEMQVSVLINPSTFIQEAIENIGISVCIGILIATFVLFLFMGSLRLTLVIAVSIPLSLIGGFIMMSMAGIELNLISLGAMALAVGMVVDGSIVVLENIDRHLKDRKFSSFKERLECVYQAVMEVRSAVIASLFTTIIVFAPLAYTAPLANAILGDLAKVIVCVLLISVLVTIVVVPPLVMLLRSKSKGGHGGLYLFPRVFLIILGFFEQKYLTFLKYLVANKLRSRLFLLAVCSGFGLSFYVLISQVEREILATPNTDKVWLNIEFQKEGLDIEEVEKLIGPYENILRREFADGISRFMSMVSDDEASILCNLVDKSEIGVIKEKLEKRFKNTPEVHFHVRPWNPTSLEIPEPPAMRIHLVGEDEVTKREILALIEELARSHEEVGRIRTYPRSGKSKDHQIQYNQDLLEYVKRRDGSSFSEQKIEDILSYMIKGKDIKNIKIAGHRDPVKVTLGFPDHTIQDPKEIKNMLVNLSGKIIPVRHFAEIKETKYWKEWFTERGQDEFKVDIFVKSYAEDRKALVAAEIRKDLDDHKDIDASLLVYDDTQKEINENIYSLVYALLLALGLIWVVINLQFGSLKQTFIVMCAIPLGFIGMSFSIYTFGSTLSVNSMLGLILLSGTAVNNSILFVDFFNQIRDSLKESIIEKLMMTARLRFRPILITTTTTILGMLPIALGFGSGGEILQPLGIAVCGGLGLSSLLTLFVVPITLGLGEL